MTTRVISDLTRALIDAFLDDRTPSVEFQCIGLRRTEEQRREGGPLKLWKFPDQVIRLAILFVIAGAVLLVIRQRFVPETFGRLGHYRADAIAANADRPIQYAGREACIECHEEQGQVLTASFHRTLACEVCHGPAANHAEDPGAHRPVVPRERGAACLFCHEYLASRPTGFPQIIERNHNPGAPCIGCHQPHDPTPPNVPETCAACHTEIARTKSVSHHASLGCTTCHEVDPVHMQLPRTALPTVPTDRQFCGRCHDTKATSPANIPRVEIGSHGTPYLCWQCHYPHFPES